MCHCFAGVDNTAKLLQEYKALETNILMFTESNFLHIYPRICASDEVKAPASPLRLSVRYLAVTLEVYIVICTT